MARRKNDYKLAVEVALEDKKPEFQAAYSRVASKYNSINAARLTSSGKQDMDEIGHHLHKLKDEFSTAERVQANATKEQVKKLNLRRLIRKGVQVLALFVCFLFLTDHPEISAVILIGVLVARSILKKQEKKTAARIAGESWRFCYQAIGVLGQPESLERRSSGIYLRLDNIFLSSLSDMDRMIEMQRRAAERQELQAQKRHEETIGVMRQNIAVQREILFEQYDQTNIARDHAYKSFSDRRR